MKKWNVELIGQARKNAKKLPSRLIESLRVLLSDLEGGPEVSKWPNYGKLGKLIYHCHLKKGRPTYVVCCTVYKKEKNIEVFYAGTHQNAPY